ncbi:hypothetical protein GGR56DRAFT_673349 [Xylariaceae sp. FL0804]|nr:hypothetical protein GGR56DRAFT_673349 [Xylariaceae sp. FL0804]
MSFYFQEAVDPLGNPVAGAYAYVPVLRGDTVDLQTLLDDDDDDDDNDDDHDDDDDDDDDDHDDHDREGHGGPGTEDCGQPAFIIFSQQKTRRKGKKEQYF